MESANDFQEKDWSLYNLSCRTFVSIKYPFPPTKYSQSDSYLIVIQVRVLHPSVIFTIPCGLPKAEIPLTTLLSRFLVFRGDNLRIPSNMPPSLPKILSKSQRDHNSLLDLDTRNSPSSILQKCYRRLSVSI